MYSIVSGWIVILYRKILFAYVFEKGDANLDMAKLYNLYKPVGERNIASVYVDGRFVASGSSENKENAKLHAAEAALSKLTRSKTDDATSTHTYGDFNEAADIEGAKQKVHELCNKKRWPKPSYGYCSMLYDV